MIEKLITITVGYAVLLVICGCLLNNYELQNRKVSTFVTGIGQYNKSASVLD